MRCLQRKSLLPGYSHGPSSENPLPLVGPFPHLLEVAVLALLPVHHIVEDGHHDVPHLLLRNQSDAQERTNHPRDEVQLVLPWMKTNTQH